MGAADIEGRFTWMLLIPLLLTMIVSWLVNSPVTSTYWAGRALLTPWTGKKGAVVRTGSLAPRLPSESCLARGSNLMPLWREGVLSGNGSGGASPSLGLPPLFDFSGLPTEEEACAHCKNKDDLMHCCGVCVFEHRRCAELHPGNATTPRVLGDLATLTWHFFLAVECFLHHFATSLQRRNVTEDPVLLEQIKHQVFGAGHKFAGVVRYPFCTHLAEGTRLCVARADDGAELTQRVLPTLRVLGRDLTNDILVFNFGLHIGHDRFGKELELAAEYVEKHRSWLPRMVWMDVPPQHFLGQNGRYRKGVPRQPCVGISHFPLVQQGGPWNAMAGRHLQRFWQLGIAHLATHNATIPFHYVHLRKDCTHFCQPAAYQLWTYLLAETLLASRLASPSPVEDRGPGQGAVS